MSSLYTIREGELVHDNVKDTLFPVRSELIKIKGQNSTWTCLFFDLKKNLCTIYSHRPMECRVLECWNTDAIKKIYNINRLSRKQLISDVNGLWELVEDHSIRCSYKVLGELAGSLGKTNTGDTAGKIMEIIGYDSNIRELVVEKAGIAPDITDFLFGRPLEKTLKMFNLKVHYSSGNATLKQLNKSALSIRNNR